jgi:outer membrane protein TolC
MKGRANIQGLALRSGGRRARPVIAASLLLPLLCACATVQPTRLSTQESASAFRTRSLDDPGLKQFAVTPGAAYTAWPPPLYDARALDVAALYFSPTVAVARAKAQAAQAAIVTAGEIPNPTLNLAPQYVTNAEAGMPAWVLAASLLQVIETAGKRDFRVARARYLAQAARFDALNTAWDAIAAVNGALIDVASGQRRLAVLDAQVEALTALADAADRRLTAGLGSSLESATAHTALNKSIIDREASRAAVTDAQHRLAQAIGVPVDALPLPQLMADLPEAKLSTAQRQSLQQDAVLNRADLLARLADYGASDAALQLEAARQYPDVELGPGYEYDQGLHKWGVSLNLPLPIFNQNRGPIGEARTARQQAADTFMETQARVIGDVGRTLAAYDAARQAQRVAEDLAQRATQTLRGQQALFDRGEIDRVALLEAEVEMTNAQLAVTDAEGTLAKALLGLEQASQRSVNGFDPAPLLEPAGGDHAPKS